MSGSAITQADRQVVRVRTSPDAPRVPYKDCGDFVEKWESVSYAYIALLDAIFDKYIQEASVTGVRRLAWTNSDNLVLGICQFEELSIAGVGLLQVATCGRGLQWVIRLNRLLQNTVATACRTYVATMRQNGCISADRSTMNFMRILAQCEVKSILQQARSLMHDAQAGFHMPTVDSCRAWLNESPITQLFRINFLRVVTSDRNHFVVMPTDDWPKYLAAVCMSQHLRLGLQSPLSVLCADAFRKVCDHL